MLRALRPADKSARPIGKLKRTPEIKYILMMNAMRVGSVYGGASGWQQKDILAHIAFTKSWTKSLGESGGLASTEGLALPDRARIVRAGRDGAPITDGVFPETEEFPAGYWIVDVESPERAYQIAARRAGGAGSRRNPVEHADRSAGDDRPA
jgi:hypothetical protein